MAATLFSIVQFPMGRLAGDVIAHVMKTTFHGLLPPRNNILAVLSVGTMDVAEATQHISVAMGQRDCRQLLDALVACGAVMKGGVNHRELSRLFREHPSEEEPDDPLIVAIVRINSLQYGEQCYVSKGTDPNNVDCILLEPSPDGPPAIGSTRCAHPC